MGDWFSRLGQRLTDWVIVRARRQSDPESLIAGLIATIWAVLAGLGGGVLLVLFFLAVMWLLHAAAVESGRYLSIWVATGFLLVLILVAVAVVAPAFLAPLPMAVAGSTALFYNEAVRFNYNRRRQAVIGQSLAPAAGLAAGAAAALGLVGVGVAVIAANSQDRNWLWMATAAMVLLVVGFAFTLAPGRNAPGTSAKPWQPGDRIPPQPLGREEFDQY